MDFFARQPVTRSQPDAVKKIDLFGCQPRRVRAEVENLFLARRRENLEREAGAGLRHTFPGDADFTRLLERRDFRGTSAHDCRRFQIRGSAQDAVPKVAGSDYGEANWLALLFRDRQYSREEKLLDRAKKLFWSEIGFTRGRARQQLDVKGDNLRVPSAGAS